MQFSRIRFLGCTRLRARRCHQTNTLRRLTSVIRGLAMLTNSRLPKGIRRASPFTVLLRLPAMPSHPSLRFRPNSVSRFPLRVSISVYHTPEFSASRSPWGLPSSYAYLFLHATACGLRRTSSSKPLRMILYCLRRTLTPSASATSSSRSCTSTSGCAVTPTACRILCLRFTCFVRQHLC